LLSPDYKKAGILGSIDGNRMETIMSSYVLAFFDKYFSRRYGTCNGVGCRASDTSAGLFLRCPFRDNDFSDTLYCFFLTPKILLRNIQASSNSEDAFLFSFFFSGNVYTVILKYYDDKFLKYWLRMIVKKSHQRVALGIVIDYRFA